MAKPEDKEPLYVYLSISDVTDSAVLAKYDKGKMRLIYYVNHIFYDAENRYSIMEKFIMTLVYSARKLRPYFQAHPIWVLIDRPLRQALYTTDASGHMMKYACELSAYGIKYLPREANKAQALADFISELTGNPELIEPDHQNEQLEEEKWQA